MEKKDRNEWTKKFRELGKKKGSHKDFAKLYNCLLYTSDAADD